jgi:chromosome segregation protein
LANLDGEIRISQEKNRELQKDLSLAREENIRIQTIKENLIERKSNVEIEIQNDFEVTLLNFVENFSGKEHFNASTIEVENKLERQIRHRDALGSVNLRAEKDAQEIRDELETILSEKMDVVHAVEKLNSAVKDLNKDGRQKLIKAFDEVNKTFQSLFSKLFQGGNGELALVDSKDPLEAGLEIFCQPPGKKVTTLSLLSGGEQTLTALALIFSVFLVNPSPVCLMDEVDAPLDDANIIKYCDILDYMIEKTETRFLVITHNIITITRMNRLYGITMMEKGVSQLVGVDLGKAEQLIN